MPHFGLMNVEDLGPGEAALQRARLHLRAGKRRLRQGKFSHGIGTLYDALLFAMYWYLASPERRTKLRIGNKLNLRNDRGLYQLLVDSGVVDSGFHFDHFQRLLNRALRHEIPRFDYHELLQGVESVMTQLGVMPFDERDLPPEDPATH